MRNYCVSFLLKIYHFMQKYYFLRHMTNFSRLIVSRCVLWFFDSYERRHPTEEMRQSHEILKHPNSNLKIVYKMLEDEKSKETFKDVLKYRATKKQKYLRHVSVNDQYVPKDIIKLSGNEIFVDGGAFNGADSMRIFMRRGYGHIYFFEPSEKNIKQIEELIRRYRLKDVTVCNIGLWNKKDTLCFSDSGDMGAAISADGTDKIAVDTIDNICEGEVSFIKMDIEGAELEALEGAKNTIQAYKPKLAISIYHKPEHMYEIALYIKELVPEYRLFVRHHSYSREEVVLYAVL